MKRTILILLGVSCLVAGTVAMAAAPSGVGAVAQNVIGNLKNLARLITAGAYVGGMCCVVFAIAKFKAHKDNPTQIPIGTPIALLFVGAALIFSPSIMGVTGKTLLGSSGATQGGISGVTSFGK